MISNPIIQRELIGMLRTTRAVAALVGLLVILTLLVLLRWPTEGMVNLAGQQSQQVLRIFGYGLMVGLILLAPAFPATTIVRERRSGTLALLLNSPMRPWSIFLGKLLGVVGFVLLLIIVSLAPAAACFAMGGVGLTSQLLPMYLVLTLLALQYATLGLLVSSFATSSDSALRVTYGLVLLFSVLSLAPDLFLRGLLGGTAAQVLDWIRCISPIPAMMAILNQEALISRGLQGPGAVVQRYILLSVFSILVFSIWTAARLTGWMLDRPRAEGKVTDERSLGVRIFRRIMYLWFFDPQRRTGLIGPWTNPVMVKEFRCRRFGRSNWMMRLIAASAVISLALAYFASSTALKMAGRQESVGDVLGAILVVFQMALIVLLTPSMAAGLISSERESGGWELLQMTPLSPFSIMCGKLMSVAWTVGLLLLATLPGYAVMILIEPEKKQRVINVLVSLILTALFATLSSAAISSLFRRTATATATAYAFLVGLCAGTLLFWVGRDAPFGYTTVQWALRFNPLAGALELIQAPGFIGYNLVPINWWIVALGCLLSVAVLLARIWYLTRPS